MNNIITHHQCPVCFSNQIQKVFTAKDYTVSKQDFEIFHCNNCSARFTQNVPDLESISRYYQSENYVSHTDVKKGIINNLYHLVRKYTLLQKKRLVQSVSGKDKGALLDVGAGTGAFGAVMHQAGWQVTALEPNETARENAKSNQGILLHHVKEIYQLPASAFDAITLWHVLEHVHELHEYLNIFYQALKPEGILIIAVPNYTSYDAQYYKNSWAAYDVPRHLYHFSFQSMQMLLRQHGFYIMKYEPLWFDSFYVSMLSEQYLTGKNNFIRACWNGLVSNIKTMKDVKKCSSVIYIIRKQK